MSAAGPRVLVVDDSAVVRQTLSAILTHDGCEVTTAADAIFAGERLKSLTPDVIVLDLEMPHVDGLSFLRKLMRETPLPVVICSAFAGPGTAKALRALEYGAVDVVAKPRLGVRDFLYESAVTISDTVRAAASARLPQPRRQTAVESSAPKPRKADAPAAVPSTTLVAIGASTGGTDALRTILRGLDRHDAGVVIVQHMPRHFTGAFARALDAICSIEVREAVSGDAVGRGTALLAPGDAHLSVRRAGRGFAVDVCDGPLISRHRPSIDVLFHSVAEAAGASGVGVILTGMGDDGAAGLAEMRRAGAFTIAQDEATSVVFGMPKRAIEYGAAEEVLPLSEIAGAIRRRQKKSRQ
jgi:two-component system chemotaxis response regulator CheB